MDADNYPTTQCEKGISPHEDTLIAQLRRNKLRFTEQLETVNAALEALENNPEVTKILELVRKAGSFRS
jgi:Fe2+ or Zn2+ uptake regulation protein